MSEPDETRVAAAGAGRVGRRRAGEADDDARWGGVYLAVIVFTAVVIAALWAFSRAFSS